MAMASSGSFGEVAGPLVYNAFVTTAQTRTWLIVNNYNYSLGFYIVKPNLTDASINISVTNGTIAAGKFYPINVTIVSHTTDTQSGYITAYAVPTNNTNNSGAGASIRLAVIKLIEINGTNVTIKNQAPSQGSANKSQSVGTKIQGQGIQGSTSSISVQSTIPTTNTTISQNAPNTSKQAPMAAYLVAAIVVLIVACSLAYYAINRNKNAKRKKSRKKR